MLKKYCITSTGYISFAFFLSTEVYGVSLISNYHITESSMKRLLTVGIKQPNFKWNGNVITFEANKKGIKLNNSDNDVLPEETERIDEIVALPGYKGIGPYTEEEIQPILAYLGVEDDVSEK